MTQNIPKIRVSRRRKRRVLPVRQRRKKTWVQWFFFNQRNRIARRTNMSYISEAGFYICRNGAFQGLDDTRPISCRFLGITHMKIIPPKLKCICQHFSRSPSTLAKVVESMSSYGRAKQTRD